MITFWGLLTESDIETYVGGLLLPAYMSYLQRAPFQFEKQPSNPDGRQPLLVTYQGDGRIEDYRIHPKKHAFDLLRSICPGMEAESLLIDEKEPAWHWSPAFSRKQAEAWDFQEPTPVSMRIYFKPKRSKLPERNAESPSRFDSEQCYVSISRKEMFIGRNVLRDYFSAWLRHLEGSATETATDGDDPLEMETICGGMMFQGTRLGGEYILQKGDAFDDLLRYCGLERVLKDVEDNVRLDIETAETEIDEDGFRFYLVSSLADP